MKLSATEKFDRKQFKNMVIAKNGIVYTTEHYGITVVAVPACGRVGSEFVQVAVAQCSPGDAFKRKRGELVALTRWANGCVLSVRRNGRCLESVASDMADFLSM